MANRINIDNYEAFLLDYMEGNISTEDLVALQIFAAQHPHLNIDLNDMELVELGSEEIQFNGKDDLKKPLLSDEQFVAYIEHELNAEQEKNLETLCATNESLAKELKLYKSTIVSADTRIVFENKNALKKQETKVIWFFSREVLAAAASLVLIAGLWFMFKTVVPAGTENFNSEKLKGISTLKTIAFRNHNSQAVDPTQKNQELPKHSNHVAHSNVNNKKESLTNHNPALIADNSSKDTSSVKAKDIIPVKKTDYLADNSSKQNPAVTANTIKPYIITEKAYDEDEKILAAATPKKGFWNKAMNALNGLNKLGVKKAKGTETVETNNEQHVLTLGNFKVENHKYNAE